MGREEVASWQIFEKEERPEVKKRAGEAGAEYSGCIDQSFRTLKALCLILIDAD